MLGKPSVRFPLFFWLAYWIAGCFSIFVHYPHPYFFFITFACFAVGVMWALLAMDTQYELNTEWSMTDEEREKWIMAMRKKYPEVWKNAIGNNREEKKK